MLVPPENLSGLLLLVRTPPSETSVFRSALEDARLESHSPGGWPVYEQMWVEVMMLKSWQRSPMRIM